MWFYHNIQRIRKIDIHHHHHHHHRHPHHHHLFAIKSMIYKTLCSGSCNPVSKKRYFDRKLCRGTIPTILQILIQIGSLDQECMRDFAPCLEQSWFGYFWSTLSNPQPRWPHGIWRKIRQKTLFVVRVCLSWSQNHNLICTPSFFPENRHLVAKFRQYLQTSARKPL